MIFVEIEYFKYEKFYDMDIAKKHLQRVLFRYFNLLALKNITVQEKEDKTVDIMRMWTNRHVPLDYHIHEDEINV